MTQLTVFSRCAGRWHGRTLWGQVIPPDPECVACRRRIAGLEVKQIPQRSDEPEVKWILPPPRFTRCEVRLPA